MRRKIRKGKAEVAGTGTKISDLCFDVTRYDCGQGKQKKKVIPTCNPHLGTGLVYKAHSATCIVLDAQSQGRCCLCLSGVCPEHKGSMWSTIQLYQKLLMSQRGKLVSHQRLSVSAVGSH